MAKGYNQKFGEDYDEAFSPIVSALKHMLSYVKHTQRQGILLSASDKITLQAFSDSDWGSCPDTRKFVTGYIIILGKSPIS